MTIHSALGHNQAHDQLPGSHLSPVDWDILNMDILWMDLTVGRGVELIGYHKRRRRSTWRYADGRVKYLYPMDRLAV